MSGRIIPPPPPPPPCTDAPAWSASGFDVDDDLESLLDDAAQAPPTDAGRAELAKERAKLEAERAALQEERAELDQRSRRLKQEKAELDKKVAREVEARLASHRAAFAREKAAIEERVAREVDALRAVVRSDSLELRPEPRPAKPSSESDERRLSRAQRMLMRRRIG